MTNDISAILQTDDNLKNSLKDQKSNLSQTLWSSFLQKEKSSNWFLKLAENVAGFLISNKSKNGSFAKNQISTDMSDREDWWIKKTYNEIIL